MRFPRSLHCVVLVLMICLLPINYCDDLSKKLRRYKICNGGRCKAIRSYNPPSFLQEMDSFLYSRWTRWASCTRHCTTKRLRACKFPLICGNTVIHEEAFCYHRGTHCEFIFENNKRDFLATADDTDYLDQPEYEYHSHENSKVDSGNAAPARNYAVASPTAVTSSSYFNNRGQSSSDRIPDANGNAFVRKPENHYGSNSRQSRHEKFQVRRSYQNQTQLGRGSNTNEIRGYQNSLDDENAFATDDKQTCGVARITDLNRNGIAMRILGGKEARKGRWPWQVAVLNRMQEAFCGGTLIAPRWILTAAHCIRKKLHVTIGEHHLHRDEGTEKHYKIDAAFIHPDFDHETVDNDIALLLLPEPVPTEAGLACLPNDNQLLPPSGTLCTILGWGKERHTHVFGTTVLHEGKVPLVSNAECRYTYGKYEITDNMFCAGYRGGTVDSCAGDSGGPILCSVDSRWTVFGVTSFGDGCGRKGKFGIYAKVANYVEWIRKVMKANEYLD